MGDFVADLQAVWPLVVQQPWPFLAFGLAIFVIGAAVGLVLRRARIKLLKDKLVRRDETIAALESEISYSKAFHESPQVRSKQLDVTMRGQSRPSWDG